MLSERGEGVGGGGTTQKWRVDGIAAAVIGTGRIEKTEYLPLPSRALRWPEK